MATRLVAEDFYNQAEFLVDWEMSSCYMLFFFVCSIFCQPYMPWSQSVPATCITSICSHSTMSIATTQTGWAWIGIRCTHSTQQGKRRLFSPPTWTKAPGATQLRAPRHAPRNQISCTGTGAGPGRSHRHWPLQTPIMWSHYAMSCRRDGTRSMLRRLHSTKLVRTTAPKIRCSGSGAGISICVTRTAILRQRKREKKLCWCMHLHLFSWSESRI
jgi:hypothetical protein